MWLNHFDYMLLRNLDASHGPVLGATGAALVDKAEV